MLVAFIACLAGLVVVLVALARDEPPARQAPPTLPASARLDFPLASPGYDPAAVEAYLEAVACALADLLSVAPPEIIERARCLGLLEPAAKAGEESVQAPRHDAGPGIDPDTEDEEALRAEAALVVIEAARALLHPDPATLGSSPSGGRPL
ncbi:MAG: hypothetical protein ACRDYA_24840 [Egibacteraceae bacterium]